MTDEPMLLEPALDVVQACPEPRPSDDATKFQVDPTGRVFVTTAFEDVQIPIRFWSDCTPDDKCPEGTNFTARIVTAVTYGGILNPLPGDPAPQTVNPAPFDATDATNACIADRFNEPADPNVPSSGGVFAVFDKCRNASQNFTRLFARN